MLFKPRPFSLPSSIFGNATFLVIQLVLQACTGASFNQFQEAVLRGSLNLALACFALYLITLLIISRRRFHPPSDRFFATTGFGILYLPAYLFYSFLAYP